MRVEEFLLLVVGHAAVDKSPLHIGLVVQDVTVGDEHIKVLADFQRAHTVRDAHDARRNDGDRFQARLVRQTTAHGEARFDGQHADVAAFEAAEIHTFRRRRHRHHATTLVQDGRILNARATGGSLLLVLRAAVTCRQDDARTGAPELIGYCPAFLTALDHRAEAVLLCQTRNAQQVITIRGVELGQRLATQNRQHRAIDAALLGLGQVLLLLDLALPLAELAHIARSLGELLA